MTGIYKITNLVDNKFYIGSSKKDIKQRWNRHKWELKNNRHGNKKLQNAYNKYGLGSFKFEILEIVNDIDLIPEIEKKYIIKYGALERDIGYNLSENTVGVCLSGNKHPAFGKIRSDEFKQKISNATKGNKHPLYGTHVSETTKEKMRATIGDKMSGSNNPNAVSIVQLTCTGNLIKIWDCITTASINLKLDNPTLNSHLNNKKNIRSVGGYVWLYYHEYIKYSKKEIIRLCVKKSHNKHFKIVVQLSKNLEFINKYNSINEASITENISESGIQACCKGRYKTSGGYIWMYYEDWLKLHSNEIAS